MKQGVLAHGSPCQASTFLVFNDGKTLVFASPVEQSITFVFATATKDGVCICVHELQNGSAEPEPDPEPDPAPNNTWKDWTLKKTKLLVPSSRLSSGAKLAAAMENVIASIESGRITTPKKGREAIRAANRSVFSEEERQAWMPFFEALNSKCETYAASGKLTTLSQHKEIWEGVAAGLREVSK